MLRGLLNIFLYPLSLIWSFVYQIRRFAYNYGFFKQHKFYVPIISVGNITFGGTGKTPFTLWLSEFAQTFDKKVLILMRGYKGKLEHGHGILEANKKMGLNPIKFGDEPILLARRLKNCSVVVGKNRALNLDFYFDRSQPDLVVLDDGHQHLAVHRQMNIVLFDALLPLNSLKVAPMGYLREGLSALKDADIIILGRADMASNSNLIELERTIAPYLKKGVPIIHMGYRPVSVRNQNSEILMPIEGLKGKKVIALAGIASPNSFFKMLNNLEAKVINTYTFPDHYDFKIRDLSPILELAEKEDALIVATEKDMVKLRRLTSSPRLSFVEIAVDFPKDRDVLEKMIRGIIC